jgi:hypothetical protein
MEHCLQLAAENAELRHFVSGVAAPQFLPDRLAEAIAVEQLASPDTGAVEFRQETEAREDTDGVRQHVEANAELSQLGRLLEYLWLKSGLVQAEGGGEATDTAANDQDLLAITTVHRTDSVQIAPAGSAFSKSELKGRYLN